MIRFIFLIFLVIAELGAGLVLQETTLWAKGKRHISKLTADISEAKAEKRRLLLASGEDKTVDLEFDANVGANGISYGNPVIAVATLVKIGDKKQIVFKPLKAGETTVTVRDAEGNMRVIFYIHVTANNLLRIASELRNLLRDIEGLDIRVVGSKVIVEGEVIVPLDYGKVLTVVQDKAYSDNVISMVTVSPMTMQALAKKIQEDINRFAPTVTTRVVNGMILLEGTVKNADNAKRAAATAALYLPDLRPGSLLEKDPSVQRMQARPLIQNYIMIDAEPPRGLDKMVRVTVHFVELTKDYDKVFGFQWEPGFTGDPTIAIGQGANGAAGATSTTSNSGMSFSATISSLIPKLASMQTAGFGRVVRTGTIITRSGQPAQINEQQQVSYSQLGYGGMATSARLTVGTTISVTPAVMPQSENIQLDVDLNQTDITGAASTAGGGPTTSIHKVKTMFYVKSNESAAIGAMNANNISTNYNQDPPLQGSFTQQTIPLFELLRSKNYQKQRTQYYIFVTPQIIEDAAEASRDLKRNFRIKVQ